ncbi:MAG: rhodanese-like domain-containing protein, partial [Actinomycetota bacterium]
MKALEASRLTDTARFLDVREDYEFAAGHIQGSVHIPIGQISTRFEDLDRGATFVVVCQIGQRSALVADFLNERGFVTHNL